MDKRGTSQAARYVTRMNRYTRVSKLLDKCHWLSIRQLIAMYSVILLWRLWNCDTWSMLKIGLKPMNGWLFSPMNRRILLTKYLWNNKLMNIWNKLPSDLRLDHSQNFNTVKHESLKRNYYYFLLYYCLDVTVSYCGKKY